MSTKELIIANKSYLIAPVLGFLPLGLTLASAAHIAVIISAIVSVAYTYWRWNKDRKK